MIEREDYDARPRAYANAIYLTGQSRGTISQYEYIGRSLEQSWFNGVVLRSRLREETSIRLIIGPCKGHTRRTLNPPKPFFNNTNYQVIL